MEKSRTFQELIDMSRRVIDAFNGIERRQWTIETAMIELTKQVGELSKHIMVAERYYLQDRDNDPRYRTSPPEIADELADVLHAVIRIALHYDIDLEQAHVNARHAEMQYIGNPEDF